MFSDLNQLTRWVEQGGGPVPHVEVEGEADWLTARIAEAQARLAAARVTVEEAAAAALAADAAYAAALEQHKLDVIARRQTPRAVALGDAAREAQAQVNEAKASAQVKLTELRALPKGSSERTVCNEELEAIHAATRVLQRAASSANRESDAFRQVPLPTRRRTPSQGDAAIDVGRAERTLATLTGMRDKVVVDDGLTAAAGNLRVLLEAQGKLARELAAAFEVLHAARRRVGDHGSDDHVVRYLFNATLSDEELSAFIAVAEPASGNYPYA